ncbi:MAG: glycosyltransferase family 39 protein, partial [Verrucomicrobiae bacterium]|nr:glycosyltransferase family 39 protein [Verrucomicrobiae bacterium]
MSTCKAPEAGPTCLARLSQSQSTGIFERFNGWLFLALAAAALTLAYRLGSLPLINPDEGRNAEIAREMKERGEWLIPTYNGVTRLDKPAFYFKTVAFSLAAFGDNELAARIPSFLFGAAILMLVWAWCRRETTPRVAALAVLVMATTPLFVSQARTVILDIALAWFVGLAIIAGYSAEQLTGQRRRGMYLLSWLATGMATLVKGPVGLVVPMLVLLLFHGVEKRWEACKRLLSPMN